MTTSTIDQSIEARLRASGVRYTKARRAVVEALGRADGPLSAGELVDVVRPDVPLSSVYRTLSVLEEAGVIVPHYGARSLTRYELAEWIAGHHHHLVCVECGAIVDIDVPAALESRVGGVVDDLAGLADFKAIGHSLEIEGRCPECR